MFPGACGRSDAGPPVLELQHFLQQGRGNVCLDETLVFHFSLELERSSVTAASLRIVDELERPAAGRLRVEGRRLTFAPHLPRRPDLTDGGLRPGVRYRVELVGFPRPDGLRSGTGLPLAASLQLEFRTAAQGGGDPLFAGAVLERGPWLHVPPQEPGPLDPLEVVCEGEGIDPTSLSLGEFAITSLSDVHAGPIALEPRLVENRLDRARLALHPVRGAGGKGPRPVLQPGEWYLARIGSRLRSLGGRPVIELFDAPLPQITVGARSFGRERVGFEGASRRRDVEPPDMLPGGEGVGAEGQVLRLDGTAHWPEEGEAIGLRYPAAAGDGHDGVHAPLARWPVESGGSNDLHATEIVLGEADLLDLGARGGPIVLRSQGSIDIRGRLVRGLVGPPERSLEEELVGLQRLPGARWPTLSDWLARALDSSEPWTILVAGGDIRISGHLEVAGSLLLVAGGWVRVTGYVGAASIWKSPEGGENLLRVSDVPLLLDPPTHNPLRKPLTLGVLTHAIRPRGGVRAWAQARVRRRAGGGWAQVRYIGLRDDPNAPGGVVEFDPVTDLAALDDCEAVRLLCLVGMPRGRGEPWDPPRIDEVELLWLGP